MATNTDKNTDKAHFEASLDAIKKALNAKGVDFNQKAEACLEMLNAALGFFTAEGALAKASVEVQLAFEKGGRFIRKYALATREQWGEVQTYLKITDVQENE